MEQRPGQGQPLALASGQIFAPLGQQGVQPPLPPEKARAIYILKGGPGCGKSTLMGKIGDWAEEAGLETEYILCSGDPGSLDAVVIPALKAAVVDGTAPQGVVP